MNRMRLRNFRLSDAEDERLKSLAERYDINISTLVRHAVNAYVRTERPFDDSADLIAVDYLTWNYIWLKTIEASEAQGQAKDEIDGIVQRVRSVVDERGTGDVDEYFVHEMWMAMETTQLLELQILEMFEEIRDGLKKVDTTRLLELSRVGKVTIDGARAGNPETSMRASRNYASGTGGRTPSSSPSKVMPQGKTHLPAASAPRSPETQQSPAPLAS